MSSKNAHYLWVNEKGNPIEGGCSYPSFFKQTQYFKSTEDRFFGYGWFEVGDEKNPKFGDHFVPAGSDPIENINQYIRNSLQRRKDKFDEGKIIIFLIIDLSDLAKEHDRFHRGGKIDEVIKKQLKSIHKQDDVYNVYSNDFLQRLFDVLNPPFTGEKLKNYLAERNITYISDYVIEQCSPEGYKLPPIDKLTQEERSWFKKDLNINYKSIPKFSNYRQFSLLDRHNSAVDEINNVIEISQSEKKSKSFIKKWFNKIKRTSYINVVDMDDELQQFRKDPKGWISKILWKVDKFGTSESLLNKYLQLHNIQTNLTRINDRLFHFSTDHPTTKFYFCNFTEGQKGVTHNEALNVYRRMVELCEGNPSNKLIFIIADYQPLMKENVLSFLQRTRLKGISRVNDVKNNNFEFISIEDWVTNKCL
jgi:hypothetical protein